MRSCGVLAGVLLLVALLGTPVVVAAAGEAHVFVYHRFGESRYPSTNIDLKVFEQQLQLLRDGDYAVLPLGEVVRRLRAGVALPERCAVLTIDDAFVSFWSGGLPLLRRFGFPATLFVNSDSIGTPGYAGWAELRALTADNIEIGNQSASHDYLVDRRKDESTSAWQRRVQSDLRRAQTQLRSQLGRTPTLFAYPYGEYDPALQELVRAEGFEAAIMQNSGVITAQSDLWALPRFPMGGGSANLAEFRQKLLMHALPVTVLEPLSPVVDAAQMPAMTIVIADGRVDLSRLQCFVNGVPGCSVRRLAEPAGAFLVTSEGVIKGRRGKYTLTAPGPDGWYWFSQLWIRAERPRSAPVAAGAGDASSHR